VRKWFKFDSPLTERQRSILLYGSSAGNTGKGFLTETEALSAWIEHRAELLKQAGSRGRPHAYLKYELADTTPYYVADLLVLYRRGLLPAPSETTTLTADQPDDLHREFESAESIRALGFETPLLESICRQMGNVLAYHSYRGRAVLVKKYLAIHAALRQVLRERLSVLVP
jgi:hypothetical protein